MTPFKKGHKAKVIVINNSKNARIRTTKLGEHQSDTYKFDIDCPIVVIGERVECLFVDVFWLVDIVFGNNILSNRGAGIETRF